MRTAPNPNPDAIRNALKLKQLEATRAFREKYPDAFSHLKSKGVELSNLREHSAKLLSAGALASTLFLTAPDQLKDLPSPSEIIRLADFEEKSLPVRLASNVVIQTFNKILPDKPRNLSRDEEKYLEQFIEKTIGVKARATLEGEHLNTVYGLIGAEQHLRRYPGDTVGQHGEGSVLKEGMAPGLGAWGYFAQSKQAFSEDLEETEKWYAVVQTLYLPEWSKRQPYLRDWYKYRKVLIVNTKNGKAVVASIADAGPAAWTGKHFGGSPEVMEYLGGSRYKKGEVLVLFVDDPDNNVALGPVEYNNKSISLGKI